MLPPAPELPSCSQREQPQCLPDPVTLQNPPRTRPSGTLPSPSVRAPLGVETLGCSWPSVTPLIGPGTQRCIWSSSKGAHHHHHLAPIHPCPRVFRPLGFCPHCPCCLLHPCPGPYPIRARSDHRGLRPWVPLPASAGTQLGQRTSKFLWLSRFQFLRL